MFRRLGGVSVLVAGLALTALTPGAAFAAPLDSTTSSSTIAGVVTAAASCDFAPRTLTLRARARAVQFEVPEATDWRVQIPDLGVDAAPGHQVKNFKATEFENSDAGLHQVTVTKDGESCTSSFRLMRASMLTMVVIHKAPYRYLGGQAVRFNFGKAGGRSVMPGAKVTVQRFSPKDGWVSEKLLSTNKKGVFVGRMKIGKRTWRSVMKSTSTTSGSVSKAAKTELQWKEVQGLL